MSHCMTKYQPLMTKFEPLYDKVPANYMTKCYNCFHLPNSALQNWSCGCEGMQEQPSVKRVEKMANMHTANNKKLESIMKTEKKNDNR